jgi:diguanylate cyclase (GGDEF)-like protein
VPASSPLRHTPQVPADDGSATPRSDVVPLAGSDAPDATDQDFSAVVRPLLELVARMTGLDTAFVTSIDWVGQLQVVVEATPADALVQAGSTVAWSESMCRRLFLSGTPVTTDVPGTYPDSPGSEVGMVTFMALPIGEGGATLGTLCGASRQPVPLSTEVLESVSLVAQAMTGLLRAEQRRRRAEAANLEVAQLSRTLAQGSQALAAELDHLRRLATTDELTGLANRRGFTAAWEQLGTDALRTGQPVGLLLLDVDDFKAINDRFGHLAGDDVLRTIADTVRVACRSTDVLGRLGGDELAVGLIGGGTDACRATAERIESQLAAVSVELPAPVTVSIGTASTETTAFDELFAAADRSLYAHKRRRPHRIGPTVGSSTA